MRFVFFFQISQELFMKIMSLLVDAADLSIDRGKQLRNNKVHVKFSSSVQVFFAFFGTTGSSFQINKKVESSQAEKQVDISSSTEKFFIPISC